MKFENFILISLLAVLALSQIAFADGIVLTMTKPKPVVLQESHGSVSNQFLVAASVNTPRPTYLDSRTTPISASLAASLNLPTPQIAGMGNGASSAFSGGIAMGTNFRSSFGPSAFPRVGIIAPLRILPTKPITGGRTTIYVPLRDMDSHFDP